MILFFVMQQAEYLLRRQETGRIRAGARPASFVSNRRDGWDDGSTQYFKALTPDGSFASLWLRRALSPD